MAKKKTPSLVPVGKRIKQARQKKKVTYEALANETELIVVVYNP